MTDNTEDEEQALIDKLGTTAATPMRPEADKLKTVSGIEALEGHMINIVCAEKGSQLHEPGLGWRMAELIPAGDLDQINRAIREQLNRYEYRIDHSNLEVSAGPLSDGKMPVAITYTLAGGSKKRKMTANVHWPPTY
jgi:phage baseplate assembly protein W